MFKVGLRFYKLPTYRQSMVMKLLCVVTITKKNFKYRTWIKEILGFQKMEWPKHILGDEATKNTLHILDIMPQVIKLYFISDNSFRSLSPPKNMILHLLVNFQCYSTSKVWVFVGKYILPIEMWSVIYLWQGFCSKQFDFCSHYGICFAEIDEWCHWIDSNSTQIKPNLSSCGRPSNFTKWNRTRFNWDRMWSNFKPRSTISETATYQ